MATFLSLFHLFALFLIFSPWANGQGSPRSDPSRSLRLCKVQKVTSSPGPTMDAIRFGLDRLLDGKLPKDGWRSTWTAWYQKDPAVTFDLGESKRIGAIRVYFQAWAR
ncbi:MAG: hypothetical protein P8N21_07565, partial [Opitutales bacterium]|nr:hypothetical protein [Opitutales bacterium]